MTNPENGKNAFYVEISETFHIADIRFESWDVQVCFLGVLANPYRQLCRWAWAQMANAWTNEAIGGLTGSLISEESKTLVSSRIFRDICNAVRNMEVGVFVRRDR